MEHSIARHEYGGPATIVKGLHFEEQMQSVVHSCAQVLGWSVALKGAPHLMPALRNDPWLARYLARHCR